MPARPDRSSPRAELRSDWPLALIGLGLGLSAFLHGYYEIGAWGPLALGALAVVLALVVSRPLPTGVPALAAIGGLGLLWAWSLLSTRWAESAAQAVNEANRWALYAALLTALVMLVRGDSGRRALLGGATGAILALAAFLLAKMLAGDGPSLFLTNRLNEPVEYVNGVAAYLALGIWPLVAIAERARSAAVGAVAVALTVPLLSLTLMTQSRGAIAAVALSIVVMIALVPGRRRRCWVLLAAGLGVAIAWPWLGDVLETLPAGATAPPEETLQNAAAAVLLSSLLAGLAWLAAATAAEAVQSRDEATRSTVETVSAAGLAAILCVGAALLLFPLGDRIDRVQDQYDAFTELRPAEPGGRIASGGGNRYDYWRVAVDQFEDEPLHGIGAGNYDTTYFVERRTTEAIRQPHSIELQALAETGLVGGLALLLFVGGVALGLWRRARPADPSYDPALVVAAGGMFSVWLLHSSVDWIQLIPGVAGIALCAAATLVAPGKPSARAEPARPALAGAIGVLLAVAAIFIARATVAEHLRSDGYDTLQSDPQAALADARDSLAIDDESLAGYYLESAALARLGDYEGAREALIEATRREPHDFVSWGLLGDLETRRGDTQAAARAYARAGELNPREAGSLDRG